MEAFSGDIVGFSQPENANQIDLNDSTEQIHEEYYLDFCVKYSTGLGWIKQDQIPLLKENYLKPIYAAYCKAIDDVKNGLKTEQNHEEILKNVIKLLNKILFHTRRIGVTDHGNIYKGIMDLYDWTTRKAISNEYEEYAMALLMQVVRDVIFQ